ncbi:DUF1826 domain-containing protein [Marinomonas balearica]|uniref:Uncharacterized protein DUF1826 n=1 Tax=Marinomonas balearica TaxID=491947 RepID=A0A4R6M3N3_9GAMM|nr:DUF1826 domain-containing protein [Marinomonas balearica]TDO95908.1 uncharacterized protein DUF1826 [Marinomonas balearica]
MSLAASSSTESSHREVVETVFCRSSHLVEELVDISQIYESELNFVAWNRTLETALEEAVEHLVSILSERTKVFSHSETVSVLSIDTTLRRIFPEFDGRDILINDIALLFDAFSCLFELEEVGLRIALVKRAMCPRFHVDQVPCRLVTTYCGPATQWLENSNINRAKLGRGNDGLADEISGLMAKDTVKLQLKAGDVALLKGEKWPDNESLGAVHRSPDVSEDEVRLLVTFDFA